MLENKVRNLAIVCMLLAISACSQQQMLALQGKSLPTTPSADTVITPSKPNKLGNPNVAYAAFQRALLVKSMIDRCGFSVNGKKMDHINSTIEDYRPYTNSFDYTVLINRGGETSPVDTNELCLTASWKEKYNAALSTF